MHSITICHLFVVFCMVSVVLAKPAKKPHKTQFAYPCKGTKGVILEYDKDIIGAESGSFIIHLDLSLSQPDSKKASDSGDSKDVYTLLDVPNVKVDQTKTEDEKTMVTVSELDANTFDTLAMNVHWNGGKIPEVLSIKMNHAEVCKHPIKLFSEE